MDRNETFKHAWYKSMVLINIPKLMSIQIKAVKFKNLQHPEEADQYYAVAKSRNELSLDDLSKRIASMSTVSRADIYAVLIALTETLPDALEEGNIVRLGSLGSFMIRVSSNPSQTAEEVNAHQITQVKLRFRPGKEIQNKLQSFKIEKQ